MKKSCTVCFILLLLFPMFSLNGAVNSIRKNPVVNAVKQASPAVVNISTERVVRVRENPFSQFHYDPFSSMESFLNDFFSPKTHKKKVPNSLGSGVIVDNQNHVLTNHHVIMSSSEIKITLPDKREFKAKLVGGDPRFDIAVLKILDAKQKLPKIEMGSSNDLMIGETVIAIGNPFGLSNTVTTGVISAIGRTVKASEQNVFENFIQTDASINPGNSGGPLLNIEGKLIGINTAIYEKAQGIGFAIPIDSARKIMRSLLVYGELPPVWLGFKVDRFKKGGVYVSMLEDSSPAAKSGLRAGDKLIKMGKRLINDTEDFSHAVSRYTIKDQIPIVVKRNNKELNFKVFAKKFPKDYGLKIAGDRMGLTVTDNTKISRLRYGVKSKNGVIVSGIIKDSVAAKMGIKKGDTIHQIDADEIKSVKDFEKASLKLFYSDSAMIKLERGPYIYKFVMRLL